MKLILVTTLLSCLNFFWCKEPSSIMNQTIRKTNSETISATLNDSLIVYQTENLIIQKLSNHIYEHISYLTTDDFGKVACNGMLVVNENEGVLFDTPSDDKSSVELINFVTKELNCKIIALIPTHFHNDCIGGIAVFEERSIPIYASTQTIELLNENGQKFSKSIKNFDDSLTVDIGNKKVYAEYFGEGHTIDNIVGYFPNDQAVFGGCLIKEVGAGKGYLGDANIKEWPETVGKVKVKYPNAKIVIPGHGKWGETELFDYTIKLFN